jgi:hypothetical protein
MGEQEKRADEGPEKHTARPSQQAKPSPRKRERSAVLSGWVKTSLGSASWLTDGDVSSDSMLNYFETRAFSLDGLRSYGQIRLAPLSLQGEDRQ